MGAGDTAEIEGRTLVSMFGEDCILRVGRSRTRQQAPHTKKRKDHRDNHRIHQEDEKVERRSRGCLCWSGSSSRVAGKLNVDSI